MSLSIKRCKITRICAGVLCLWCLMPSASAQQKLSIQECRDRAIANNLQQTIAQMQSEQAAYTLKSMEANFLPKFSLSGLMFFSDAEFSKTISGGYLPTYVPDEAGNMIPNILTAGADGLPIFNMYAYMPDIPISLELNSGFMGSLKLEQPIYMGGKIQTAYKMANVATEMASLNENLTREEIIVQADEAYITCVKTHQMVASLQQYKAAVEELYRVVENAVTAGMAERKDLLTVQVKLNEVALNLMRAQNGVKLSTMNLCHAIGLPLDESIDVEDEFLTEESASLLQTNADVSERVEYALLSKQVELKDYAVRLEKSAMLPEVGLMASYGYAKGLQLNSETLLDHANFTALFSVSVPLVHWGEVRNKVKAAEQEKEIAAQQRDDAARKMELEMTQARNAYEESLFEVTLTQKSLEQAEENMKVSKNRYDIGMEMLADYLEAQTLWQKAESELIGAQASLCLSRTVYLKAIGAL